MSAVTTTRPGIAPQTAIARHPRLAATYAEDDKDGMECFPLPLLCAFLDRLERKFPGMQILRLRPWTSYDSYGDFRSISTQVAFSWTAEAILEARLLPQSAIPRGRKRVWRGSHHHTVAEVEKRAGGRIDVLLYGVPQDVPPSDPCAFFSPSSIGFEPHPSQEAAEEYRNTRCAADWKNRMRKFCENSLATNGVWLDGTCGGRRFRLDEHSLARIQARTSDYLAELLREIDRAQVIDREGVASTLRLIIDNTRKGQR